MQFYRIRRGRLGRPSRWNVIYAPCALKGANSRTHHIFSINLLLFAPICVELMTMPAKTHILCRLPSWSQHVACVFRDPSPCGARMARERAFAKNRAIDRARSRASAILSTNALMETVACHRARKDREAPETLRGPHAHEAREFTPELLAESIGRVGEPVCPDIG